MNKNSLLRKRFFRTFLFTLAIGLMIIGGTLWLLRSLVRQPAIPAHAAQPFFHPSIIAPPITPSETPAPQPSEAPAVISQPEPENENEWVRKPDFFTVLLFGHETNNNADTIMVAALDLPARQAYIVSIPRDTRVDVSRNVKRINAAFSAGRRADGSHEGGAMQLMREVQTIIGFKPDYYVSVENRAFVRIVDAVGGVEIDVPFHMNYHDPVQNLRINIPAGRQRLNGENALHFVRYRIGSDRRHTISDTIRMQHQQAFLSAMMDELLSPRTILRVPELVRTYRDHVRTDLDLTEMLWFAEQFVLGDITLNTYNYPTTSLLQTFWYEIPNAEEALELINRTINPFTRDLSEDNLQLLR